jgi:predicted O-methyltransferase YrrM
VTAARDRLVDLGDKVVRRAAHAARTTSTRADDVELALTAALRNVDVLDLHDPPGFVHFLRSCWTPLTVPVQVQIALPQGDLTPPQLRYRELLGQLSSAVPSVPGHAAVSIGRYLDGLVASQVPFDRPWTSTDVGAHAAVSSSLGQSGRILMACLRWTRARSVLELGTAYGLGSSFIGEALRASPQPGHLATIEASLPQSSFSSALLAASYSEVVTAHVGRSEVVLPTVLADHGPFDVLFHDAEHSERAYVEDFASVVDALRPGALVVYDDINWNDPSQPAAAGTTRRGWEAVTRHPRVQAAAEVDGRYGFALLG